MATREECEDAIKKIKEAFYSTICEEWELEQIAVNLDFLLSLINEHFKEHPETNYEHYKDEIIEDSGLTLALVGGKPCKCSSVHCSDCEFSTGHGCSEKMKEWLASTYKKTTYKLTRFELDLIQTYRDCYDECKLSDRRILRELKDKGHFKYVDESAKIHDILANCEVID